MVEKLQGWQREGGARKNTLGAPALAKQTKSGDPLQVQVDKARGTYWYILKKWNNSDFGGDKVDV